MIDNIKLNRIITKIEDNQGFYFSSMKEKILDSEFIDKLLEHSIIIYMEYVSEHLSEGLVRTKHPFYFFLKKNGDDLYKTTIFFQESKKQELMLLLNSVKKK